MSCIVGILVSRRPKCTWQLGQKFGVYKLLFFKTYFIFIYFIYFLFQIIPKFLALSEPKPVQKDSLESDGGVNVGSVCGRVKNNTATGHFMEL